MIIMFVLVIVVIATKVMMGISHGDGDETEIGKQNSQIRTQK